MSERNLTVFKAATRAFNRLASDTDELDSEDFGDWLAAMDPEIRFDPQQAALQGTYAGHNGARRWLADLRAHYGAGRIDYAEVHDLGDRALGLGTIHIVGRGSGIETDVPTAILVTFRGGLITRLQDFGADREGALKAAGLWE